MNISKSFIVAVALAAAAAAGSTAARAEGLYLGGAIGMPDYNRDVNGIGSYGYNGSSAGVKGYAGYQLSPHIGVEGGLFSLGHVSDYNGTANTRGLFVQGVGTMGVASDFSLLGSVGLAHGRFTTTLGDGNSPAVKLGGGVQWDFSRQAALRVEYERYHFTNAFDNKVDAGEFSLGVRMAF